MKRRKAAPAKAKKMKAARSRRVQSTLKELRTMLGVSTSGQALTLAIALAARKRVV